MTARKPVDLYWLVSAKEGVTPDGHKVTYILFRMRGKKFKATRRLIVDGIPSEDSIAGVSDREALAFLRDWKRRDGQPVAELPPFDRSILEP